MMTWAVNTIFFLLRAILGDDDLPGATSTYVT